MELQGRISPNLRRIVRMKNGTVTRLGPLQAGIIVLALATAIITGIPLASALI